MVSLSRWGPGGVSGPWGEIRAEMPDELSWNYLGRAAHDALAAQGWSVSGAWEPAGFAGIMVTTVEPAASGA